METSEKGCAGVCPKCGQFMLEMKPDNPAFNDYVFELLKKASIAADRRVKEEEDLFEGYLITQADALSIRDYFDRVREEVEFAAIPEEVRLVREKLADARLHSKKEHLQRLFRYKRDEMLLYANYRLEEMARQDEGFTEEELTPCSEFSARMARVLSTIVDLSSEGAGAKLVPINTLIEKCKSDGLMIGDIMRAIERLKREGEIFEPMRGRILPI